MSLRPVLLLLFLLLIPGTFAWYDNGWLYRKNITFNSSQINGTHSDFPVLVNLENGLTVVTTTHHVIDCSWVLYAGSTRHCWQAYQR